MNERSNACYKVLFQCPLIGGGQGMHLVQIPCFQHIKREEFKICVELHLNAFGGVDIMDTNVAF